MVSVDVTLFEAMPAPGRKFLVAGKGGLNITRDEPFQHFVEHYGNRRQHIEPFLRNFDAETVRHWMLDLGFKTFVGSSGNVYPEIMNAGPVLVAWMRRLKARGLKIHSRHIWKGWSPEDDLLFETPSGSVAVTSKATILCLGGGSRPELGSTGSWVPVLRDRGVAVEPLKPANCGFDVIWSDHFRTSFKGHPVKNVALSFINAQGEHFYRKGEFMITESGITGSAVYMLSAPIRDDLQRRSPVTLSLDLLPEKSIDHIILRLNKPRKSRTLSSHLEKTLGLKGVKRNLLYEFLPKENFGDPCTLSGHIKCLPIPLVSHSPLAEAISSAGGVSFDSLDDGLMIRALPGTFCAGEMIDWEAPTGGYLLTACFATGHAAGHSVLKWINNS
jgi:uncharacterized flavoprotein (TIGR03862 family)